MKNILLTLVGFFLFSNCTSQNYIEKGLLNTLVEQEQFTFMAERANIMNQDVINAMNSLPGGSSSRLQQLDYGYDIIFTNKEMRVNLPYFGRAYNSTRDQDNIGFRFTSKDYSIEKKEGKKGGKILTIKPNDINNINVLYLEISPNGKAYLSISANDREPGSYSGYIMKNEIKKEK